MLEHLDFWLAMFTLGALAWYELKLSRVVMPIIRALISAARAGQAAVAERRRLRPSPIRRSNGQFNGSAPAAAVVPDHRSEMEPRSSDRSASERRVPAGNDVPIGTNSPAEIAMIALRLGQGMPPSDVAKSLPGYSARKYQAYMAKVNQVLADLATVEPEKEPAGQAERHEAQPKLGMI
jgi:hypothetical protein